MAGQSNTSLLPVPVTLVTAADPVMVQPEVLTGDPPSWANTCVCAREGVNANAASNTNKQYFIFEKLLVEFNASSGLTQGMEKALKIQKGSGKGLVRGRKNEL
jgi:hypothetical protein